MSDMIKGPDTRWVEEVTHQGIPHPGRQGDSAPAEATRLVRKAEELASGPVLSALQEASDDLYAWAAARVAQDDTQDLQQLMEEMATFGLGDLAAEASSILEKLDHRRAGEVGRLEIGEVQWPADANYPGQGELKIDGQSWSMLDYREEVPMSDELAALVKVPEPQEEKRQCVTRVLAAGVLQRQLGRPPSQKEVDVKAEEMRREHCYQAVDAAEQLGEAEEFVTAVEHELRTYVHDIITPHHEKDFRCLAVFPLADLQDAKLVVLRADYRGDLLVETVVGSQWHSGGWHVWALISRGHMMLVQPPAQWDATAWLRKEERFSTPSLGFSFFYHQRHDQSRTAPGKVQCRLCKGTRRAGEGPGDTLVRRHSCLAAVAALAGEIPKGPQVRRMVRPTSKQLNFKELFAGHAVMTKEWREQGGRAVDPVEVYEQPHVQKGYRPEHDLLRAEIREQHLLAARQGPENVGWVASPCTSFCDWGLQNGGTRTFDRPRGDEGGRITQKEEDGNTLSDFGAAYFVAMLDSGGFPICESTAPSGRYPKQRHLPSWKAVLQRPDVDYVDLDMCAFGLGPPDVEGQFYRHATRVVFPRHEPLRRALMKTCPGVSASHVHIPLKGNRPGVPVSRCTEAGVYAKEFVRTVVECLLATLVVGGGSGSPPRGLHAGGADGDQHQPEDDEAEEEEDEVAATGVCSAPGTSLTLGTSSTLGASSTLRTSSALGTSSAFGTSSTLGTSLTLGTSATLGTSSALRAMPESHGEGGMEDIEEEEATEDAELELGKELEGSEEDPRAALRRRLLKKFEEDPMVSAAISAGAVSEPRPSSSFRRRVLRRLGHVPDDGAGVQGIGTIREGEGTASGEEQLSQLEGMSHLEEGGEEEEERTGSGSVEEIRQTSTPEETEATGASEASIDVWGLLQQSAEGVESRRRRTRFRPTEEEQRELERLPCTRGPDGGDCGCCRACCQGLQGCGLCTKCWAQGIRRDCESEEEEQISRCESQTESGGGGGPEARANEEFETCSYAPTTPSEDQGVGHPEEDVLESKDAERSFGFHDRKGRKRGICRSGPDGYGCGFCEICDPTEGFLEKGAPVPVSGEAQEESGSPGTEETRTEEDEDRPDTWELCSGGYVMVRHHRPRSTLFVPPPHRENVLTPNKFRNERQTHIWYRDANGGVQQVEYTDNWREAGECDPGYGLWRGVTFLTFQGRSLPWDSSSDYTNTSSTDPDDDGESPEEEHDDDLPSTLAVMVDEDGAENNFRMDRAGGYHAPHDQAKKEAKVYT